MVKTTLKVSDGATRRIVVLKRGRLPAPHSGTVPSHAGEGFGYLQNHRGHVLIT